MTVQNSPATELMLEAKELAEWLKQNWFMSLQINSRRIVDHLEGQRSNEHILDAHSNRFEECHVVS